MRHIQKNTFFFEAQNIRIGDFLFQAAREDGLDQAIRTVSYGLWGSYLTHVGIVVSLENIPQVLEAVPDRGVCLTALDDYFKRSHDTLGRPCILHQRLRPSYRYLLHRALSFLEKWVGCVYNATFTPFNGSSMFYCSQLIVDAFCLANDGLPLFPTMPMHFLSAHGHISPFWIDYFQKLGATIPEGQIGTNPAALSRSCDQLEVIQIYGNIW